MSFKVDQFVVFMADTIILLVIENIHNQYHIILLKNHLNIRITMWLFTSTCFCILAYCVVYSRDVYNFCVPSVHCSLISVHRSLISASNFDKLQWASQAGVPVHFPLHVFFLDEYYAKFLYTSVDRGCPQSANISFYECNYARLGLIHIILYEIAIN